MSRILVFESSPRTLRIVQRCLEPMGYEILPVDDKERLKLEMRASEPALILASAEMAGGSGLEVVNDQYSECRTPVPVIVFSGRHTLTELKEVCPVELNVGAFLSTPFDSGELVQQLLLPGHDWINERTLLAHIHNEYLAVARSAFLYFHCFCLGSAGAEDTDADGADDSAGTAYLDEIGVHRGDHKIIEYLAHVVKMQLLAEGDSAAQDSGAFPTIHLDFSECETFRGKVVPV